MSNQIARRFAPLALLALGLATAPISAQSVTLYGSLSNFDVVNDTGAETQGFEIEFHGVTNVYSYYNWNRYGMPTVTPMPGGAGMYIRWIAPWDAARGVYTTGTPSAVKPTVMTGHQCIQGTAGYDTSGCEHFGISTTGNPTKTVYRWLVADAANPGQVKPAGSLVAIPAPVWSIVPAAQPAAAPVVVAVVQAPIPVPPAKLYGPAQWMKVYKNENKRHVALEELVADNAVVPENAAEMEVTWDLVQNDLLPHGKRNRKQNQGALGGGSQAVVRRYEFYKYTGAYDPITNEALCADLTCSAPSEAELGDFIGAQNAAANLNAPVQFPVTVTVVGDGQVSSGDRIIRCPGVCRESINTGSVVTLTAKGGKGVFAGWGGACAGNNLTCTVSVNSEAPVTATFLSQFKLVVKTNGLGTVSSNPSGGSYTQGTPVTVTAAPAAGAVWKGWTGGGCSGLALSCTVKIAADTIVSANFR